MEKNKYPRAFSHVGITVPDIHKAVEFYQEVMGCYYVAHKS
jgi:catechol 2,3-dioxygenase-like lactoylglutathione lyase family enzyme